MADTHREKSDGQLGSDAFMQFISMMLSVDPNGKHRHRCPKCKHIWEHENTCNEHDIFDAAHTCKCGEMVTRKYDGAGLPEFRSCKVAA